LEAGHQGETRQAILEILRETKSGLPADWGATAKHGDAESDEQTADRLASLQLPALPARLDAGVSGEKTSSKTE
jgi:hypothetical protein